jgi:citrate synthase
MNSTITTEAPGVEPFVAPRGLKGVIVTDTVVGDVRGTEGFFHYHEHPTPELARHRSIEEVWHLLLHGHLPDPNTLDAFHHRVRSLRAIDPGVQKVARAGASVGPVPMELLRTVLSAGSSGPSWLDLSPAERLETADQLIGAMPTFAASAWQALAGGDAPSPDPDLSFAADYLRMVRGTTPTAAEIRALSRYIILTIDHGLNASTFTARTVTSTGGSLGSAAVPALGALSGPLHGGAPSLVLDMLLEIGEPERARSWIRATLERGDKLMGFGHAVYRTADPRSELLKETAAELGGPLSELAFAVEPIALEEMERHRPGADLRTNVEF